MKDRMVASLKVMLKGARTGRDLHSLWERRQPLPEPKKGESEGKTGESADLIPWLQSGLEVAVRFCELALAKEEFLLVCDCAGEALRLWPEKTRSATISVGHVRLRRCYATALDRLGRPLDARKQLEPYVDGPLAPELKAGVFLQLGNILREESACAPMDAARDEIAKQALHYYRRALEVVPAMPEALTLTAAVGFLIGRPGSTVHKQARQSARQLLASRRPPARGDLSSYDRIEHRAVALAVLEEPEKARQAFEELTGLSDATTTLLADTRYWARTLAQGLKQPDDYFDPAFPPLPLVVFSGHLPDLPGRGLPARFPPGSVDAVRRRLRAELRKVNARVGMASAAAGADLLFIDELHALGGKVHLILPWSEEEFRITSVVPYDEAGGGRMWQELFDKAVANAASVRTIGEAYRTADDAGHAYTMEVTAGLALHAARTLRLDVCPLALWDGRPGEVDGGTAAFVKFWDGLHALSRKEAADGGDGVRSDRRKETVGKTVVIPLPRPRVPAAVVGHVSAPPADKEVSRSERGRFGQEIKTLLFADIVGYSKLRETAIEPFVMLFLDRISQLVATSRHAPCHVNTWGDAIYGVFDFAYDAGCFAMELIQLIRDGHDEWKAAKLFSQEINAEGKLVERPLDIRVGLHTGPVFMHYNPVVRSLGFTGVHVSKAARIEPVAQPGEVYASEEFTALAELDRTIRRLSGSDGQTGTALSFLCEYAGSRSLAKSYPGRHRLYRVAPHRVYSKETLARAIHAHYVETEKMERHTPAGNASMCPWEKLTEKKRNSNRTSAEDLPNKLEYLGYELAPSFGERASVIEISDEQAVYLAKSEHERWMEEQRRNNWKYGKTRDDTRQRHPSLLRWDRLPEAERQKNLASVRNVPKLVEAMGFRVRKIVRAP